MQSDDKREWYDMDSVPRSGHRVIVEQMGEVYVAWWQEGSLWRHDTQGFVRVYPERWTHYDGKTANIGAEMRANRTLAKTLHRNLVAAREHMTKLGKVVETAATECRNAYRAEFRWRVCAVFMFVCNAVQLALALIYVSSIVCK